MSLHSNPPPTNPLHIRSLRCLGGDSLRVRSSIVQCVPPSQPPSAPAKARSFVPGPLGRPTQPTKRSQPSETSGLGDKAGPHTGAPIPSTGSHPGPVKVTGQVALLSFFDGIATALFALKGLGVAPERRHRQNCEPQGAARRQPCNTRSQAPTPNTRLAPSEVAQQLSQVLTKGTTVLVCGAPPCHDFSVIRSSAPGTSGAERVKFVRWSEWLLQFVRACTFRVVFLAENVSMSSSLQSELDQALQTSSFLCDASTWGVVSRPRLWWSNVLQPPAATECIPPTVLGGAARWRRVNRYWELVPCSPLLPKQVAASCPHARFHSEVEAGRVRFPCITTPADSPQGRPPPLKKRRSESPGTMSRWQASQRAYPPWQFRARRL